MILFPDQSYYSVWFLNQRVLQRCSWTNVLTKSSQIGWVHHWFVFKECGPSQYHEIESLRCNCICTSRFSRFHRTSLDWKEMIRLRIIPQITWYVSVNNINKTYEVCNTTNGKPETQLYKWSVTIITTIVQQNTNTSSIWTLLLQ